MPNPNAPLWRLKRAVTARWFAEDYPGASPRFQVALLSKDLGTFILLPLGAIGLFKACEGMGAQRPRPKATPASISEISHGDAPRSQIIDLRTAASHSPFAGIVRRAPGALARVKLLNVVEAYGTVPVHAQVVDEGLGGNLLGAELVGDATAEPAFERMNIVFHYARDPHHQAVAIPLAGRALSLDGTLGLEAAKKESFLTRSALGSATSTKQDIQGRSGDTTDLRQVLLKALTAGLVQEFGSANQVEANRSQVLALAPGKEFFVELTEPFPGSTK